MAITFSKTSGSGNSGKIDITSDLYQGRINKVTNYSVSGSGAAATIVIEQVSPGLILNIDDDLVVSKDEGSITISGTSNGSHISWSYTNDDGALSDEFFYVNGNGAYVEDEMLQPIPDDIGANELYQFDIQLLLLENKSISSREFTVTIKAYGDDNVEPVIKTLTITQEGGTSYVYVSQTEGEETTSCDLTIASGETSTYVYIMSNDSWTISEV